MTGKQRIREIFATFANRTAHFKVGTEEEVTFWKEAELALDSIEEVVKEVLGERQELAADWLRKSDGANMNALLTEQLGRWEGDNGQ